MAERDLAVEAGQHVEAEQGDRVDQHQRHLEYVVVAERERQRDRECERDRRDGEPAQVEAAVG